MAPRVSLDALASLQTNTEQIRNICILAHVDHGKTTLSDSLVSSNGIISERLAGTLRYLDSRDDEQQRGITMEASGISLLFRHERAQKDFLINLVDSPGHVDFSSDVSTAVRLCDGAIVLVDVVEGVGYQTHAVLRQAWEERLKPCLVLNKIDRLVTELKLDAVEAYERLQRIVEQVNAIVLSYFSASAMEETGKKIDEQSANAPEDDDLVFNEREEEALTFAPEKGNVVFASAVDGWAFRVVDLVPMVASAVGLPRKKVHRSLWGNFCFNQSTKKITELKTKSSSAAQGQSLRKNPPMFASFILESIWQVYHATLVAPKPKRVERMVEKLGIKDAVPERELRKGGKSALRAVMGSWLPLTRAVLSMVIRCVPDPRVAQKRRIGVLWPAHHPGNERHAEAADDSTRREIQDSLSSVRQAVEECNEAGPLVAFVSKMFAVPLNQLRKETVEAVRNLGHNAANEGQSECFFAFARVFAGTIAPDSKIFVLGPKHSPYDPSRSSPHKKLLDGGISPLLVMGTDLVPLSAAPAGNIVAVAGLSDTILKTATLTTSAHCCSLTKMPAQSAPILRVSIEPVNPLEWDRVSEGLRILNRADPVAEIRILPNGEHVLGAIGELHLERCVKDLTERFAKTELRVSAPIAVFRETLVRDVTVPSLGPLARIPPLSPEELKVGRSGTREEVERPSKVDGAEEDSSPPTPLSRRVDTGGRVYASISDGFIVISLRAVALPENISRSLESLSPKLSELVGSQEVDDFEHANDTEKIAHGEDFAHRRSSIHRGSSFNLSAGSLQYDSTTADSVFMELKGAFQAGGCEWGDQALRKLWAFGPRGSGPNVLLNAMQSETSPRSASRQRTELFEQISRGVYEEFVSDAVEEDSEEHDSSSINEIVCSAIVSGFELATRAGPLCEEPLWGTAFAVDQIFIDEADRDAFARVKQKGEFALAGQVISTVRDTMVRAFDVHHLQHEHLVETGYQVRLAEGYFQSSIQCHVESYEGDTLGRLYGVLSRRRAKVQSEDLWEGTSVFSINALIPIVESFSIGDELRKKTSGAASTPQMLFSHWETIPENPFFRATTEEQLEEFGEHQYEESYMANNIAKRYIDQVRKRKGLATSQKIVVAAEKQRTLGRNK